MYKMNKRHNGIIMNTAMLYLLYAAKTVFPFITLPYLARVLSVECYGMVSFVKAMVGYAQMIIDFGFILSSVKDIVETNGDKAKISGIVGDTVVSKLMISVVAVGSILSLCFHIPLLYGNLLYVTLCLSVPVLSCFLLDFLFRGIEKMHLISLIFVFMKTISTLATILFIKSDRDVVLIPCFDLLSSVLAIALTGVIIKRLGYTLGFSGFKSCFEKLKISFGYFANSMASSVLGTLNTVLMGIFSSDIQQVAFWSVCMQIIGAAQNMYTPISNGIYPYMIKNKDFGLIRKLLLIFMPIVILGTALCYILAPMLLSIIAGEKYIGASAILRWLSPVLILSFPVAVLGWPSLGAINKIKENTTTTIGGAVVQGIGLFLLSITGTFSAIGVAIWRGISEFTLLILRIFYLYKYRDCFTKNKV